MSSDSRECGKGFLKQLVFDLVQLCMLSNFLFCSEKCNVGPPHFDKQKIKFLTELYRLNAVTYIMSDRQEQISGGKSSETHNKIQLAIACMAKW